MSEQNGQNANATVQTAEQWAVIQTGFVASDSEIVSFQDGDGNRCPQLIRLVDSEKKGKVIASRLTNASLKIVSYGKMQNNTGTPLYAVVKVTGIAPRVRKEMTPEQKKAASERMKKAQAARKAGK